MNNFTVWTNNKIKWNWFPVIVSYCCDIPEIKYIPGVLHNVTTTYPSVRYLVTSSDVKTGPLSALCLPELITMYEPEGESVITFLKYANNVLETVQTNYLEREAQIILQEMFVTLSVPFLKQMDKGHPHLFLSYVL